MKTQNQFIRKQLIIMGWLFLITFHKLSSQTIHQRSIPDFWAIRITAPVDVTFIPSDTTQIQLKGDEKYVEEVVTRVENGILFIESKDINKKEKRKINIEIFIYNHRLSMIECNGVSFFKNTGMLKTDSLKIRLSGVSSANVNVECKYISASLKGSSNLTLSGNGNLFEVKISGTSLLKSNKFWTNECNIESDGVTKSDLFVRDKITANAHDLSSIRIKGNPDETFIKTEPLSSVIITDDKDNLWKSDYRNEFRFNNKRVIIVNDKTDSLNKKRKKLNNHKFNTWEGFAIGVNGFLTKDNHFYSDTPYKFMNLNYQRSINFQLNLFSSNIEIYKKYVQIITGIGMEWRRYMFENNTTLMADTSFTYGIIKKEPGLSYKKNIFSSTLLQFPVLLEFNSHKKSKKSFHLSAGVVGQFLLCSKTKQVIEYNANETEFIRKDRYNLNVLNLKTRIAVGYSNLLLFGEYNITPLFSKNQGPLVYPFVIGFLIN
jgi:hypothetical protein